MENLKRKFDLQQILAPAALVILYIFFCLFGKNFFSTGTLVSILDSTYYVGLMAFGITFIIITGGIDLSINLPYISVITKLSHEQPRAGHHHNLCHHIAVVSLGR